MQAHKSHRCVRPHLCLLKSKRYSTIACYVEEWLVDNTAAIKNTTSTYSTIIMIKSNIV